MSTMESSPGLILPDADDKCMICGQSRDMHGDMQHKFSADGQLIQNKPAPEPKQTAPRLRPEDADLDQVKEDLAKSIQANATMRLTEVLIEKGILDGKDTMYIFSGYKG